MRKNQSLEANKTLVRRLLEEGYRGNERILEECIGSEYIDHCTWGSREGLKRTLAGYRAAFADIHCVVERMIAEEDQVAVCYRLIGSANQERKTIHAVAMFRIANGKIVEHWGHSDSFF